MRLIPILKGIWRGNWRWLALAAALFVMLVSLVVALRTYSAWQARDTIYTLETVPDSDVAIVFGAQIFGNERPSAMLADRVKMAAELYRAGKVRALLFTGDNSLDNYNEPEVMRQYALNLGVPDDAITLDYANWASTRSAWLPMPCARPATPPDRYCTASCASFHRRRCPCSTSCWGQSRRFWETHSRF